MDRERTDAPLGYEQARQWGITPDELVQAVEQVERLNAFPDKDLNKPATRGDILLIMQTLTELQARVEDIANTVAPPRPDFDTDWVTVKSGTAVRFASLEQRPLADWEGLVRFARGEQHPMPYEDLDGGRVFKKGSDTFVVVNTTRYTAGVRIKGYFAN